MTAALASGFGAAAGADAPSVSSPNSSSTFTTSPSFTACLDSTPALSAGTSTVILSVSSSTSVSPAATASPSCLTQRDTVASTMDSPSGGTLMAVMSASDYIAFREQYNLESQRHASTHDLRTRWSRSDRVSG